MKKEIIINATSTEIRVAITEDERLAEIFLEVPDKERHVGSIYLGRVERVVQGMNAAFVSIGETQDAFLHFSDVGSAMDEFKDLLDEKDDEDDDEDDAAEPGDKKVEARAPSSPDDKKSGRDEQPRGRDGKSSRDRDRAPRKDAPGARAEEEPQPTATDSDATAAPAPRERDGRSGDGRSSDRRQGRDDRRGGRDRDRRDGSRDRAEARPETDGTVQPEQAQERPAEERPAEERPTEENRGRGGNRRNDRNDQSRREKEQPPRPPVKEKDTVATADLEDQPEDLEGGDAIEEGGTPEQQEEQRKRRRKRGRRGGRGRNRRRDGEEGDAETAQTESPEGDGSEQDERPVREPENRRRDDHAEKPADDRRRDDRAEKPADDRRRDDRAEKPAADRRRDDRTEKVTDDRRRDDRAEKPADDRRRDDRAEKPADDRRRDDRTEKVTDDRRRDDRDEKPADDRRRDDRPRNDDRRRDDRGAEPQPERRQENESSGNESLSSDQRRNERSRDRERERYRHDDRVSDEGGSDDRESSQSGDDRRERDDRPAPEARGGEEGTETGAAAGNERGDGRRNNRRGNRRDRPRGDRREGEAAEPRAEAPATEQPPAELSHEETYRLGTRGDDRPLKEDRRSRETTRRNEPVKPAPRDEAPAAAEAPHEEAPANVEKSPRRARPTRGAGRGKAKDAAEPRAESPATPEPAQPETTQPAPEEAAKKPSARPRKPHRGGKRGGGEDSSDAPIKGPTADAKLPTFQTKRSGEVTIALEKGQDVIVQVTRESYASKGVRVTTKVSLPGRFLVLLPLDPSIGISRKVQLMKERRRLRRIAKSILPEGYGCIIRTVAQDKDEEVIKQDLTMLIDNWRAVEQKIKQTNGPSLLYKDQSIANTVMRDLFTPDTNRVVIDNKALYKEIRDYVAWAAPQLVEKVEFYSGSTPIFDQFGVERELHKISERRTYIPSGGYIILDQTEAMMVIDVNSGRYAGKKDQELNSLRTNLESAREIARQIRLRDIGGLIVVDFIDLYDEKNRKKVYDELKREMKRDRAKSVVLPMTQFGIVQMTRQRIRQQVVQTISEPCPVCAGSGLVQSKSTVIRNIERWLARFREGSREFRLTLTANPTIIDYLTEGSPSRLTKLMLKYFVRVKVVLDESLPVDEFHFFSLRQQADITDKFLNEPKVKEKERDRDKEREKRDAREIREVEMS
ncbi:MAG: Rne/Rng family ribonuclease [Candidatus Kapaibacterium sp.]